MKETQIKDALRNIWKQKVSYLSIVVIAMLAVMAYLGINFEAQTLMNNANEFYDATNFRDFEAVSTMLITEDDLETVRALDGVAAVEGMYQSSGELLHGEDKKSVDIVSLTKEINTPLLLEGRLPENAGECAVEQEIADALSINVGDSILLQSPGGDTAKYLLSKEFTVTALVFHPDHPLHEIIVPGNRYVIVLPEVFDLDALDGSYVKAEILLDKGVDADRFAAQYLALTDKVLAGLDVAAKEREAVRDADVHGRYQSEIDKNQAKLDDAEAELKDAREQLDDGLAKIEENQKKLDDAEKTLEENRRQLVSGRKELDDAKKELEEAAEQLAEGEIELADANAQLEDTRLQLEDAEEQLAEGKAKLVAAKEELDQGAKKLEDASAELAAGRRALAAGRAQLQAGAAQIAEGETQLAAAEEELTTSYAQIEDTKQTVRDAIKDALENALTKNGVDEDKAADAIDIIPWAEPDTDPDLTDPDLDVSKFQLTEGIEFNIPHTDYVGTVEAAIEKYDNIFNKATTALDNVGFDTSNIVTKKDDVKEDLESNLYYIGVIENFYNEAVDKLEDWNDGHAEYIDGTNQLNSAKAAYNAGLAQYNAGASELASGRAQYNEGLKKYNEGVEEYEAGVQEYEEKLALYEDGKAQYEEGLAKYQDALAQFEEAKAKYEQGLIDYQEGEEKYRDGLAAFNKGKAEYEDGKKQLEEGKQTIAEKEVEYEDGLEQFFDGQEQLEAARSAMEKLDPARWVLLGPESNTGYAFVDHNKDNVSDMGMTFALLFVVVGALVIFATVGRIVDEQRRLVGATKALGLFNREIFAKYLSFGVTGTVIGTLLGVLSGYFVIQTVLMKSYGQNYVYGGGSPSFIPSMTAIVAAGGLVLSVATVWSACTELLRSTATKLMQEKAPSVRQGKSKGNKVLPLYWRLVILNMLTDKKRVAVTVVSVAGCCTLLVAGFTMRSGVMGALDGQFREISVYDAKIAYSSEISETAGQEIAAALEDAGAGYTEILDKSVAFKAEGKISAGELICGDLSEIDSFFIRKSPETGELLPASDDGIFIHEGVADAEGLSVGDTLTLYDSGMNAHTASVAGIFSMYMGREMLMSEAAYAAVFGEEVEKNSFFVNYNGADPEALLAKVKDIPGTDEITEIAKLRETYESYAGILNLISLMMTGIAAMMAYFILLNLANMYVNQKKRELTIMRVNGFTVKEVIRYVAGESIATTLAGIIFGLLLGSLLGRRMLGLMENAQLRFVHSIQFSAWAYAAVITTVFSLIIYAVALRKVKYLKLTDVA